MSLHPDRKPFRVLRKHKDGADVENDVWEGPSAPGEPAGWRTVRTLNVTKANVGQHFAPSVSFHAELMKAI